MALKYSKTGDKEVKGFQDSKHPLMQTNSDLS